MQSFSYISPMRARETTVGISLLAAISILALLASLHISSIHGYSRGGIETEIDLRFLVVLFAFPVWLLFKLGQLYIAGEDEPARKLIATIGENWAHFAVTAYIFFLLLLNSRSFTAMKVLIPLNKPFQYDPLLADFERRLFGNDLWVYTHMVIGPSGSAVIEFTYGLWHIVNLGVVLWLLFMKDYATKFRALIVYALSWFLLGGLLGTVASSVGPIFFDHFYGGDRFAGLLEKLQAIGGVGFGSTMMGREFLLDNLGRQTFGSGISAMPSLHVGMAFLWCLIASRKGRNWLWPSGVFFVIILLGSVHLGWHWLSDGIVSMVGVYGLWRAADLLMRVAAQPILRAPLPA